jgi:ParB-like chromosome segregation protein Spo0J
MKKHAFNIFPEASDEDFNRLLEDIRNNGFDQSQPVIVYDGAILDGWNRYRACQALGISPAIKTFDGDQAAALRLVMRTNKRRNLNKGQWATIAVEAEELMARLREGSLQGKRNDIIQRVADAVKDGKVRPLVAGAAIEEFDRGTSDNFLSDVDEHANKTATKAAELFNTNRTYVNQAAKVKSEAPEAFEKVKAGKMTLQDAIKEVARKPTEPEWLPDEIERKAKVEAGETVVANFQRDKHLIQWATQNGKMQAIDRTSKWGNPFILGPDGDRDRVCDCFEKHYVPNKDSFIESAHELKGKVLCCHCYPERCHGNSLIELINK